MNPPSIAEKYANQVTQLLDHVLGLDRYPVKVVQVAQEISSARFPKEPIEQVVGQDLPGFDGAIVKVAPDRGWAIIYNDGIQSRGRINYTLAHEFGHYLMHRSKYPDGLSCSPTDIARQDSDYKKIELEANTFAAYLLMPFHDFRQQIAPEEKPSWDQLSACAARYDVSLLAATLRWLEYTSLRAVLAVSKDGYVDWGKSSRKAYLSGHYFTKRNLFEVPEASPASIAGLNPGRADSIQHAPGIWFREAVTEIAIRSDAYDFTMSLLLVDNETKIYRSDQDAEVQDLDFSF